MKKTMILCLILLVVLMTGCAGKNVQIENGGSHMTETDSSFDAKAYYERLEHCVEQIRQKTDFVPEIVLVLGSGLGDYADKADVIEKIQYSEIEGFPVSTVESHDGSLIFCEIEGKKIAMMNGRIHYYEGYDMKEVVLPLRVLHLLGAQTVILTNAVGAINESYHVGDFVLVEDHISSFVPSPLIGENIDELGDRFTDMSNVYDEEMISIVENIAQRENISTHRGVMVQVTGPQYETPTEIKIFRSLGADTVGMSTVVEAIAAKHMDMRVCVINCVTNMAAGLQDTVSHEEVKSSSDKAGENFSKLVDGLLREMDQK